jgi:hypothetical protein
MDLNALHEDLYRMGNASSPNFSEARGMTDCLVVDRNGIKIVIANGNGFSAFNRVTAVMKARGKNIWRINKGSMLPLEIRIVKDQTSPGHYMLAPAKDMPFKKFLGLLEEMAATPGIAVKMSLQEINNAV